jgi:hypothetical protein
LLRLQLATSTLLAFDACPSSTRKENKAGFAKSCLALGSALLWVSPAFVFFFLFFSFLFFLFCGLPYRLYMGAFVKNKLKE